MWVLQLACVKITHAVLKFVEGKWLILVTVINPNLKLWFFLSQDLAYFSTSSLVLWVSLSATCWSLASACALCLTWSQTYHERHFLFSSPVPNKVKLNPLNINIRTLLALGCLQAFLKSAADATWDLLTSKSRDGPISSTSTRGRDPPDFFSKMLQK